MQLTQIFFYVFAIGILTAATLVVFLKNSVHAALALVFAFVSAACLWLMLEAEFLALILILVYVGAVMTLFLFVVMTINLDTESEHARLVRYYPLAFGVVAALAFMLLYIFMPNRSALLQYNRFMVHDANFSNIKALGAVLYTQYVYPFELAAVLLLVAIVAAIALNPRTIRQRKSQDINEQLRANPANRLKIVQVPVEKK